MTHTATTLKKGQSIETNGVKITYVRLVDGCPMVEVTSPEPIVKNRDRIMGRVNRVRKMAIANRAKRDV